MSRGIALYIRVLRAKMRMGSAARGTFESSSLSSSSPGPAWALWTPFLANRLQAVKQTISASLANVVKRVPGQSKGRAEAREKTGGTSVCFLPNVFSRLLSPAPLSCLCAALRAARPAQPVARERRQALSNQHAEATEIVARRNIADCFFAAFFSEESAFPLPVSRKSGFIS